MIPPPYGAPGPYPPPGYGYPPPGYPGAPNYPGHQAPGHQAPGHQAPGYPPPGYQGPGYPPPGYQGPGYQPPGFPGPIGPIALKPGIIPLRPLSLGDIFNGSVGYVRTNPKATLGLTAIVVVIAQILGLALQLGPLAVTGQLTVLQGDEASTAALVGSSLSGIAGAVAAGLASIVLSGMLTVVVGRAVFGSTITVGEAWRRVRGRIWALLGLAALELVGAILLIGAVVGIIYGTTMAANGAIAALIGIPLVIGLSVVLAYVLTMLTFAPVVVVLERKPIFASIGRSFALVRGRFWRTFGIRLLAVLIAGLIAGAVAVPFTIVGEIMLFSAESTTMILVATVLTAVGGAVGQIVTAPFAAGVVALLYTDTRIRAEAFDLVLQTGAGPGGSSGQFAPASTDDLWLGHSS